MLGVLVNGKKLELGAVYRYGLIPLGDYKAKPKKNQMEHGHFLRQQYELLFEDNSRETFDLVGERE